MAARALLYEGQLAKYGPYAPAVRRTDTRIGSNQPVAPVHRPAAIARACCVSWKGGKLRRWNLLQVTSSPIEARLDRLPTQLEGRGDGSQEKVIAEQPQLSEARIEEVEDGAISRPDLAGKAVRKLAVPSA